MENPDRCRFQWLKSLTICHLCLAIMFLGSGIFLVFLQLILRLCVKPWSRTNFRKINYFITYTLNSQLVFLASWWSDSQCILYADPDHLRNYFGKESALLLVNHNNEIDWFFGWRLADLFGVLGNAKSVLKTPLKFVPIIGWSWNLQEMIFLERNWEKDRLSLVEQMNQFSNYPSPLWLVLYPEGTRFTSEKHVESMKVARSKGLPELKHLLLPRARGFVAMRQQLKTSNIPAIYDFTVGFSPNSKPGHVPSLFNILSGRSVSANLLCRRIPIEQVPEDETEAAKWLQELFQHKDKCLDNFYKTGKFNPDGNLTEYKQFENIQVSQKLITLINEIFWFSVVILLPFFYVGRAILLSGSWEIFTAVVVIFFIAHFLMHMLINFTKTDKASSYGSNSSKKD